MCDVRIRICPHGVVGKLGQSVAKGELIVAFEEDDEEEKPKNFNCDGAIEDVWFQR